MAKTDLPTYDLPIVGDPTADRTRRERKLELAMFLFLIVPSMLLSFFAVRQGSLSFPLVAVSMMARDLSLVALVLFLVRNAREPLGAIGWTPRGAAREAAIGAALFPLVLIASGLIEAALRSAGLSAPSTPLPDLVPAPDLGQLLLAIALVAIVAISEETIFRGYLMLRLEQASGSVATAVVVSAFIFSLGHGYEGTAGVITVGLTGAALGVVYRWRRSIVAPVVIHFLLDLVAIVIAPIALR